METCAARPRVFVEGITPAIDGGHVVERPAAGKE